MFIVGYFIGLFVGIAIGLYLYHSVIGKKYIKQELSAINDRVDSLEELKPGLLVNETGWYDMENTFHYFEEIGQNDIPVGEFMLSVYRVMNGSVVYSGIPVAQTITRKDGSYIIYLPEGDYEFHFQKEHVLEWKLTRRIGKWVKIDTVQP